MEHVDVHLWDTGALTAPIEAGLSGIRSAKEGVSSRLDPPPPARTSANQLQN